MCSHSPCSFAILAMAGTGSTLVVDVVRGAQAQALATLGVEVVAADSDDAASLDRAFAGAYGAFCVTNYWEHFSAEREVSLHDLYGNWIGIAVGTLAAFVG